MNDIEDRHLSHPDSNLRRVNVSCDLALMVLEVEAGLRQTLADAENQPGPHQQMALEAITQNIIPLRLLIDRLQLRQNTGHDPHAICRRWASILHVFGVKFDCTKTAAQYAVPLGQIDEDMAAGYDKQMRILHLIAENPVECAQMALADAEMDS